MKNKVLLTMLFFSVMLSSCSVIGTIFKTGVGVGVFIAVVVVAVIVIVALKSIKSKP